MNKNCQIKIAMTLLAEGQVQEADRIFCKFLEQEPELAEALYGRACVALLTGMSALAVGFAGKAIQIKPRSYYYITLGQALYEENHPTEALSALNSALILNPSDARAHHALAKIQKGLGYGEQALNAYKEAVTLMPMDFLYWNDLIDCYWDNQDYEKSLQAAQDGVKQNPGERDFLNKLAMILQDLSLYKEAEVILRKIIHLYPKEMAAYANLGAVLFHQNRLDEAWDALHYAAIHQPYTLETQVNMALVEMALGNLSQARQILEKAYHDAPQDMRIGLNLGTVYFETGALDKAENLYTSLMKQEESFCFSETDRARLYYNFSSVMLAKKQWKLGWAYMEARHVLSNVSVMYKEVPYWDGQEFQGTLLIRSEQGLGDILQFLRFLPFVAQKNRVVFQVPSLLVRLVQEIVKIQGISENCHVMEDNLSFVGRVDYQCLLMSLPYLLGMEQVPAMVSCYFHPDQGLVSGERRKKKVGICWAGNPDYRFDRLRSIPLSLFIPLQDVEGIEFYALQANSVKEDCSFFFDHGLPAGDLLDTALIIQTLDLVITVDTVIAHLAGILGKPVWLLNRFGGDWRWYADEAGKNLWYPTLRIFRQEMMMPVSSAWQPVLAKVKQKLEWFVNPQHSRVAGERSGSL